MNTPLITRETVYEEGYNTRRLLWIIPIREQKTYTNILKILKERNPAETWALWDDFPIKDDKLKEIFQLIANMNSYPNTAFHPDDSFVFLSSPQNNTLAGDMDGYDIISDTVDILYGETFTEKQKARLEAYLTVDCKPAFDFEGRESEVEEMTLGEVLRLFHSHPERVLRMLDKE